MLRNPISQAITSTQAQVLAAQIYLDQARLQKTAQHLDVALILYDQAKVAFKNIADARELFPLLSEVKGAFIQALTPQTVEEEALRQRIAEVYFERAELLDNLGKPHKAQASRKKAQDWGYSKKQPASLPSAVLLSVSGAPALEQSAAPTSLPAHQKSTLVDYLFEKALSTLGSLEVSNKPSLFLVYAHDNENHGRAEASTAKYLIDKLSQIRVNLYSDQTPMGQPFSSSPEELEKDEQIGDILTSQLCLLPDQLRGDVKPVDKVVVCCSEVLGSYLQWPEYQEFYEKLQEAYPQDREAYRKDGEKAGASAIRTVIEQFSRQAGFHHVLTEMAFLQIRAQERGDEHGIIPVSLTPESYKHCLDHFIEATKVRMEDIPRLEEQAKAGQAVYPNQSQHWVLFKLIERVLVGSDEAKTFLNKFWQGYSDFISRLNNDNGSSTLSELEFAKFVDGIFDGIRTALHSQLVFTVQQHHQQLRMFHADPRIALKEQYFAAFKQDEAFKQTLQLYVAPHGKVSLNETINTVHLFPQVRTFLNDKYVILLTGDSGAGKTTFNRILEKQLWDQKKEPDAIPLFISLASIDKPEHNLIAKALKKKGLSEFQIQTLRTEKQKFIFILDGYDEIRQTRNIYLSNGINQPDGWQGRMVISCRSEYLGEDYRSRFQPNPHLQGEDPSFQEVVIAPFSEAERSQYLEKYVQHNQMTWAVQRYQNALEQPYLKDLVSSPFLLRVVLEALPYLESEGKAQSAIQLRLDLYDQFIRRSFERNQQRLSTQDLTGTKREIFRELCDEGFTQHGIGFVQDLAVHLYTENAGNPVVEYSLRKDKGNWKGAFFGREEEKQLLREAWPLSRSGHQYRFIHKSLLEYLVAQALFESFDACIELGTRPRRGSNASIYSFEAQPILPSRSQPEISLAPKHWVSDLGVVRWLTERVEQESTFRQQLLAIIERSKTDKTVRQAAANAITVLVRAGVHFNGANLQGIQIPGADLSDGFFDCARLEGADLSKANLRGVWLRNASLNGARMHGVEFGEWPWLEESNGVMACAYSPDGQLLAVGLDSGKINLYNATSWQKIYTLAGHIGSVYSVAYSPNGRQIASGGDDHTVRLWDAQTGQEIHILKGHSEKVLSVAYSPDGRQIASGSWDQTVHLWDTQTGKRTFHRLLLHAWHVLSVAYSPNGQQIASASDDKMVRLWDAQTGYILHTLEGHTEAVASIVYSPDGRQIASGSRDNTVRLWDTQTGQEIHTLKGHTASIRNVAYSPDGRQIVSGSDDNTVRLWSMGTGQEIRTLTGHNSSIIGLAYSPDGQQIASGSLDRAVRLWGAQTGQISPALTDNTGRIISVVVSPDGRQLVIGSGDRTVRLWDAQTGEVLHTLTGHTGYIQSVAFSPDGRQITSGSNDETVRLWDAQTGEALYTLIGHIDSIKSVVFSPDSQQIASCSNDTTVRLWDTQTGQEIHRLANPKHSIQICEYSPDGQLTAPLWDMITHEIIPLVGHTSSVNSLVYSPDGRQIASGSDDATVLLWDVASGQRQTIVEACHGAINNVAWYATPEGNAYLVTNGEDGAVRLWQVQFNGDRCQVLLCRSSTRGRLTVRGLSIQGAVGLSPMNAQLLTQRGAVREQAPIMIASASEASASPSSCPIM